jgi:hypothetical protein
VIALVEAAEAVVDHLDPSVDLIVMAQAWVEEGNHEEASRQKVADLDVACLEDGVVAHYPD